ncbi:MAG: glutathione peroxidase [Segetibacter sp.]|nr:glutathione peroxidase [Segetibacter sp.]
MKNLLFCLFLFTVVNGLAQTSIYECKITSASGSQIDFNDFRGKKIMIVNIASGSERNAQMQLLNSLCKLYTDSELVVVAFPSNDFVHEPRSNNELVTLYSGFQPNLIIAAKAKVKGEGASPVYKWITQKIFNGVLNAAMTEDFQKYLINEKGKIVGVYSARMSPLDVFVKNSLRSIK